MTALNIRNDRTKDSVKSMNTLKCYSSDEPVQGFLKAHFQPWCNARLDRSLKTFWNRRSQEPSWTYSQLFYGKYIRRSFLFHFKVSLQYFEFFPVESEEKFFVSRLDLLVLCEQSRRKG